MVWRFYTCYQRTSKSSRWSESRLLITECDTQHKRLTLIRNYYFSSSFEHVHGYHTTVTIPCSDVTDFTHLWKLCNWRSCRTYISVENLPEPYPKPIHKPQENMSDRDVWQRKPAGRVPLKHVALSIVYWLLGVRCHFMTNARAVVKNKRLKHALSLSLFHFLPSSLSPFLPGKTIDDQPS